MTPYCTVPDVERYFLNKTFNCSDYLSNSEIQSFILQDAAIIDATIQTRYSLPITGKQDLLILQMLNEKMVVGTVDDIFREKTEDGKYNRQRNTRKEALDWLKKIQDGSFLLNNSEKDSVIFFNKNDNEGDEVTKRFKDRDTEPTQSTRTLETRSIVRLQ